MSTRSILLWIVREFLRSYRKLKCVALSKRMDSASYPSSVNKDMDDEVPKSGEISGQ